MKPFIDNEKLFLKIWSLYQNLGIFMYTEVNWEDLQAELDNALPKIKIKCEHWHKSEHSTSFKALFPTENMKKVYNPDIWSTGLGLWKRHEKVSIQFLTNTLVPFSAIFVKYKLRYYFFLLIWFLSWN